MNKKVVFYLQIVLYVFFAIIFEVLIAWDPDKIIPSTQFAPILAYLLFVLLFRSMAVPIVFDFNKKILFKCCLAIIVPALIVGLSHIVCKIMGMGVVIGDSTEIKSAVLTFALYTIIASIGEEIGWRSFLQTTLEKKHSVLVSAIIVGTAWGLWHYERYTLGIWQVAAFVLLSIVFSVLMSVILKDTKNNIIISVLTHTSFNLSFPIFFDNYYSDIRVILTMDVVILLVSTVMIIVNKDYFVKQKNGT